MYCSTVRASLVEFVSLAEEVNGCIKCKWVKFCRVAGFIGEK